MRLVLIRTSVFHGLLRTVGFADYQITIPVNLGIFKTDIESCLGISDQNEKPGKRRGGDLALEWLLSGRVILPSLNFPGLNLPRLELLSKPPTHLVSLPTRTAHSLP
jgi:hypothetical protein